MRGLLLIALALVAAAGGAWILYSLADTAWRRRAEEMQTDAQWWETFQKRVRGGP